jgi:N-acyl-D-amino-acid deacylase
MNLARTALCLVLFSLSQLASAQSILIRNARVIDGSGSKAFSADVRINGDTIADIAPKLKPVAGETIVDAKRLVLSPGFIDMHSHADGGIFTKSHNAVIRQGITTVLVGQDGGEIYPLSEFFARLEKTPPTMNVASMAGHGALRHQVMGNDVRRAAKPEEIDKIKGLLEQEMRSGAMGMSGGLEYDAGHWATTDELVELNRIVQAHHGFFNAHIRDEANGTLQSFAEMEEIGRRAKVRTVITHIKLGSVPVWHQTAKVPALFAKAAADGVDLKADVYPYTFWHSNLRVIILDGDYFNPEKVKQALADNGGPERLRITHYGPDPSLEDKSLAEIADQWKMPAVDTYMKLVKSTLNPDGSPGEDDVEVMGESMHEDDVKWFIAHPRIMFSTDGELEGKHPRGAGAFPRVLGRYVREQKVLPLAAAIHKMTALPALQLGLTDRGKIAKGMKADLVLFDPATVIDRSTVEKPLDPPAGIPYVMVNGVFVVKDGQPTAARPGRALRHAQALATAK